MDAVCWPERKGHYKVIQLYLREEPMLAIGPLEKRHRQILDNILDQSGVTERPRERIQGMPVAARRGPEYSVAGMGRVFFRPEEREAEFYGASTDYEMNISEEHLEALRSRCQQWTLTNNRTRLS